VSDNKNLKPGWKVWRFDQMATNVNVRIDNPSESGMEHYVGLEHLDADSLKIRRWGTPDDVEATKLMFKKGDIIFGRRRAYQRKLGVAEFDGICSAHAMVLRAKPDVVLPEFLPFFMQSDLFMSRAVEISVGSLSPTINWKTMALQEFALPPIEEQKQISALLDNFEAVKESYEMALKTAQSFRDSLIQDAQINAAKVKLGSVCVIQGGYAFKSSEFCASGIPLVRISNIQDGLVKVTEDTPRLPNEHLSQSRKFLLQNGDLLMALSGATTGKTGIYKDDQPALLNQRVARFGLADMNVIEPYLLNELVSQASSKVLSLAAGSAQPNISTRDLELIEVAIPTISTQHQLVKVLRDIDISVEIFRQRKDLLRQMQKRVLP
jgi:type I restriction enzyme S subunit